MNQFSIHNDTLREIIGLPVEAGAINNETLVNLDNIDVVARNVLSKDEMKEAGCFFTGQDLATATLNKIKPKLSSSSIILDPTCGAGNLLIEASRQLTIKGTLSQTLKTWGHALRGFDLNHSFIEATKLRLIVEALRRGTKKDCSLETAFELLPNIRVANALAIKRSDLVDITHLLLNPPFSIWPSPNRDYWKKGKVNAAGVVFDYYVRNLPQKCYVSAILPDVLRSGSRYEDFRDFCSENLKASCTIWGKFNKKTDVDVFIISGILTKKRHEVTWLKKPSGTDILSMRFNVRIGPLVSYRSPETGPLVPYLHQRNCPQGETIEFISEHRKFSGRLIHPPFVVVKRTSSPSNKVRASATLIKDKRAVAVENHLIVVKPKSGTLQECEKIMNILHSNSTSEFLNTRIRLRHLTVGAIQEIPII